MSAALLPLLLTGISPALGAGAAAGAAIFPGLLGGGLLGGGQPDGGDFPAAPVAPESTFDDQALSQTEKNRQLRRVANNRSRALTSIQDNPIESDSLLQILAEGQ